MRRAFVRALSDLAGADDRVVLLTGDLGFTVVEPFAEQFPSRFVNVGVAEQNMVGIATGMAEAGFIPFVYSIATFATLRAYEFVRNGPALHGLPVRIVGVGGGFEYGPAGPTHHALEDLATMRVLPGMTVIAPADHRQAVSVLRATWQIPGPVYYRLGKDEDATIPGLDGAFELGRVEVVRDGTDAVIVTTGAIARVAVCAAEELAISGISCAVVVVATLSPAPVDDLIHRLRAFPIVATVEAHYRTGGLGSLVSEAIAEHGVPARVIRFGVSADGHGRTGSEEYLNRSQGLSADLISARLRSALAGEP
jgi:transketolase